MGNFLGIDFGSRSIKAVFGVKKDDNLKILAADSLPSYNSFADGQILDISKATKTIGQLMESLKSQTDLTYFDKVYICFSNPFNLNILENEANINILNRAITKESVGKVIRHALETIKINPDEKILHVLVDHFNIDKQSVVYNPLDMTGNLLNVKIKVITCPNLLINNIIKTMEKVNLQVGDIILEGIASSFSTLLEKEREEGVININFGANSSDILFIQNNSVKKIIQTEVGSHLLANDISYYYKIKTQESEQILRNFGSIGMNNSHSTFKVILQDGSELEIEYRSIKQIVSDRLEELFNFLNDKLNQEEYSKYNNSGIVFTGAISDLPGFMKLASEHFYSHVRIGKPYNMIEPVNEPDYSFNKFSAAIGLLNYAYDSQNINANNLIFTYSAINNLQRGILPEYTDTLKKTQDKPKSIENKPIKVKEKEKYHDAESEGWFDKLKKKLINIKNDFE